MPGLLAKLTGEHLQYNPAVIMALFLAGVQIRGAVDLILSRAVLPPFAVIPTEWNQITATFYLPSLLYRLLYITAFPTTEHKYFYAF